MRCLHRMHGYEPWARAGAETRDKSAWWQWCDECRCHLPTELHSPSCTANVCERDRDHEEALRKHCRSCGVESRSLTWPQHLERCAGARAEQAAANARAARAPLNPVAPPAVFENPAVGNWLNWLHRLGALHGSELADALADGLGVGGAGEADSVLTLAEELGWIRRLTCCPTPSQAVLNHHAPGEQLPSWFGWAPARPP